MMATKRGPKMRSIARVREGHQEIAELSTQIRKIIQNEVADSAAVTAFRWRMYRLLADHWALEDQAVFHRSMACGEARLTALALRFREDMVPLARRFRTSIAEWPVERINRDWTTYGRVVAELLDALEQWIRFEDQLLLPLLEAHLQQRVAA